MRSNSMVKMTGCLVLALLASGCGDRGNWKDGGMACTDENKKQIKTNPLMSSAFDMICGKGKYDDDWRCKDNRIQFKCKN